MKKAELVKKWRNAVCVCECVCAPTPSTISYDELSPVGSGRALIWNWSSKLNAKTWQEQLVKDNLHAAAWLQSQRRVNKKKSRVGGLIWSRKLLNLKCMFVERKDIKRVTKSIPPFSDPLILFRAAGAQGPVPACIGQMLKKLSDLLFKWVIYF